MEGLHLCLQILFLQELWDPGPGPFIPGWCGSCHLPLLPLEKGTTVSLFPISSSQPDLSPHSEMGQNMGGGVSEHFR